MAKHILKIIAGILIALTILGFFIDLFFVFGSYIVPFLEPLSGFLSFICYLTLFIIYSVCIYYSRLLFLLVFMLIIDGLDGIDTLQQLKKTISNANEKTTNILYLRSFIKDGQDINPMYNAGEETEKIVIEDEEKAFQKKYDGMYQSYTRLNYGSEGVKTISRFLGTGINNEISKAVNKAGKLTVFFNNKRINPGKSAKIYSSDENWKQDVSAAINTADLIIWRAGNTKALLWELTQLRELNQPKKVILFFAADGVGDFIDDFTLYQSLIEEKLKISIPEVSKKVNAIIFDADWNPICIHDKVPRFVRFLLIGSMSPNMPILSTCLKKLGYPYKRFTFIGGLLLGIIRLILAIFCLVMFILFLID